MWGGLLFLYSIWRVLNRGRGGGVMARACSLLFIYNFVLTPVRHYIQQHAITSVASENAYCATSHLLTPVKWVTV